MNNYEIISNFNGEQKLQLVVKAINEDDAIQKASKNLNIPKNILYSGIYKIKQIKSKLNK